MILKIFPNQMIWPDDATIFLAFIYLIIYLGKDS